MKKNISKQFGWLYMQVMPYKHYDLWYHLLHHWQWQKIESLWVTVISLILQDELLHKGWTGWIIKQVVKEDPRFAKVAKECEKEVYDMYMDVIREEKEWADYLFKKGPVIGLNANILKEFVDYTALESLKAINIKYNEPAPKVSPIPWFNKHSDTSKKQTALQENESTNYVIGVMSESLDYDALPQL